MSKKHVSALLTAKRRVLSGWGYVCCALPQTREGDEIAQGIHKMLRRSGAGMVTHWLEDTHGIYLNQYQKIEYRIRWIDEVLIPEWKDAP